jgi:predicted ATPase
MGRFLTIDLISAIARGRGAAGLMLIITTRPLDMVVPEHPLHTLKRDLLVHRLCQEVSLAPLSEAEIEEYLSAESPESSPPVGLAQLIHRHSEGNPLFMIAALDHMTERGLIARANGRWQLQVPLENIDVEVPETLRQMIEAQIDRLTTDEQRALEAASVIGPRFCAQAVASITKMDTELLEEEFEKLSRRFRLLRSAGSQRSKSGAISPGYEFAHTLYREVFYRRQTPGRRASLCRHLAERPKEPSAAQ